MPKTKKTAEQLEAEYRAYVNEIVAQAPPLSAKQLATISALFDYRPPRR